MINIMLLREHLLLIARICDYEPPLAYNLMDVIWPMKDIKLGSKITYSCPFRTGTTTKQLKGEQSENFLHHIQ